MNSGQSNKKSRRAIMIAATFLMTFTLATGAMFGTACRKNGKNPETTITDTYTPVELDKPQKNLNSSGKPAILPSDNKEEETFKNEYSTTTAVGVYGKITGTA